MPNRMGMPMKKHIYIIHENETWTKPLVKKLKEKDLPYEEWYLSKGIVDLTQAPPEGVFYNRMSASSHTRGHRYAPELTGAVLDWLERHDRKVFNNSRALQLEISKVRQYTALEKCGIKTPETIAAVGEEELIRAAEKMEGPFITKHNRAGKGLGVQLFLSVEALEKWIESNEEEGPIDGIWLIQQYVKSPEPFITRCEFIGGTFYYAVRVDTSEGFELCPADACRVDDMFCPVGGGAPAKFQIIKGFSDPIIEKYETFLKQNSIEIAGIEFIQDEEGTIYTYDVNTNTNYNSDAEDAAQMSGMGRIADFLGEELFKR
jgi:hypothetical protein